MKFILIMQEKNPSGSYPCYRDLNPDREVVYHIYRVTYDQYGNQNNKIIFTTECINDAKKFLRSCKLIEGIEIKDE
jgi:hypothetical protein